MTEATQAVYLEEFLKHSLEEIELATYRTIKQWDKPHMMPPIAFILARCSENPQVLAEAAWETLQRLLLREWHPDIGWTRPVELSPAMEYAIRQCGGLHRIHDCPVDSFNFLRKDFLAAHQRFTSEDGAQVRLSDGEARRILARLQRGELPS